MPEELQYLSQINKTGTVQAQAQAYLPTKEVEDAEMIPVYSHLIVNNSTKKYNGKTNLFSKW